MSGVQSLYNARRGGTKRYACRR